MRGNDCKNSSSIDNKLNRCVNRLAREQNTSENATRFNEIREIKQRARPSLGTIKLCAYQIDAVDNISRTKLQAVS